MTVWERIKETGAKMLRSIRAQAARSRRRQEAQKRQYARAVRRTRGRFASVPPALDTPPSKPLEKVPPREGQEQPEEQAERIAPDVPEERELPIGDRPAVNVATNAPEPIKESKPQEPLPKPLTPREMVRERGLAIGRERRARAGRPEPPPKFEFSGRTTTTQPESPSWNMPEKEQGQPAMRDQVYLHGRDDQHNGQPAMRDQVYLHGRDDQHNGQPAMRDDMYRVPRQQAPIDVTQPDGRGATPTVDTNAIVEAIKPLLENHKEQIIQRLTQTIHENAGYTA